MYHLDPDWGPEDSVGEQKEGESVRPSGTQLLCPRGRRARNKTCPRSTRCFGTSHQDEGLVRLVTKDTYPVNNSHYRVQEEGSIRTSVVRTEVVGGVCGRLGKIKSEDQTKFCLSINLTSFSMDYTLNRPRVPPGLSTRKLIPVLEDTSQKSLGGTSTHTSYFCRFRRGILKDPKMFGVRYKTNRRTKGYLCDPWGLS